MQTWGRFVERLVSGDAAGRINHDGLALTDEQIDLLVGELDRIIENDRYPLLPRIQALREIRALFRPYPERPPPSPPPPHYEPPSKGRYARRRR